ncbi:hypothetical protein JCM10213_007220 [Rhodosporidiobolus nylandii]
MGLGDLMNLGKQAYEQYEASQSSGKPNQQQSYGESGNESPYPSSGAGGHSSGGGGYGQQQGGEASSYYSGGNQGDSNSPYPSQPQQGSGHYGSGGGDFGVQGGSQFNSSDNRKPAASSFLSMLNGQEAVNNASAQSNEDTGLFSQALSFLQNYGDDDDDIDEQQAQQAHQQAYGQGQANLDSKSMGSAAALQAVKLFTSGGASSGSSSGGGNFQSQLIGQAMSQASKLFDQNGGASDGNKQDVVNMAAKMVMKLLIKNQVSGAIGTSLFPPSFARLALTLSLIAAGGGSAGGMGQLMGLASKFM